MVEGLYSGLGGGSAAHAVEAKMALLVEAPAAVEDAIASILNHHDPVVQVRVYT